MNAKHLTSLITACILLPVAGIHAQNLFTDNFELASPSSTSASYTIVQSGANNRITFGYDYGSLAQPNLGIPTSPNSTAGTSKGLRFEANIAGGVIAGFAISPTTTFANNYSIKFDLWMNSAGPFPGGGTGSSQAITAGVGYNGTTQTIGGGSPTQSGVWFAAMGDGGFAGTSGTPDYEARVGATLQATNSGAYAAGITGGSVGSSADNANSYYTTRFPGQTPPQAQTAFNGTGVNQTQAGATPTNKVDGTLMFKWRQVEVTRSNNIVNWFIDGYSIASVTNAAATATDKIFVGYWDPSTSIGSTNVVFGIVDNLRVDAIPEPSTIALGVIGAAGLLLARRRK